MQQETYKNYRIDHVYDCSEGYEEINHFTIWTPNDLDLVGEEFSTLEDAKTWIDDNGKPTIKKSDIKYSVEGDFYFIEDDNSEINVFKNYDQFVDFLISFADENDYFYVDDITKADFQNLQSPLDKKVRKLILRECNALHHFGDCCVGGHEDGLTDQELIDDYLWVLKDPYTFRISEGQ